MIKLILMLQVRFKFRFGPALVWPTLTMEPLAKNWSEFTACLRSPRADLSIAKGKIRVSKMQSWAVKVRVRVKVNTRNASRANQTTQITGYNLAMAAISSWVTTS